MKKIKSKTNSMLLELNDSNLDSLEKLEMDDLFVYDELQSLSQKLNEDGIENFGTYKDIMRILYEDRNLIENYKQLIPKILENFKKIENVLLVQMKLLRK